MFGHTTCVNNACMYLGSGLDRVLQAEVNEHSTVLYYIPKVLEAFAPYFFLIFSCCFFSFCVSLLLIYLFMYFCC